MSELERAFADSKMTRRVARNSNRQMGAASTIGTRRNTGNFPSSVIDSENGRRGLASLPVSGAQLNLAVNVNPENNDDLPSYSDVLKGDNEQPPPDYGQIFH